LKGTSIFLSLTPHISHSKLDRLRARHLLVAQKIEQQLQFGLFEEFAFYGYDLANAYEPAL
jgi:hypothetical protein